MSMKCATCGEVVPPGTIASRCLKCDGEAFLSSACSFDSGIQVLDELREQILKRIAEHRDAADKGDDPAGDSIISEAVGMAETLRMVRGVHQEILNRKNDSATTHGKNRETP